MSTAREIRTKISSVKSTRKITKAMEMVAASKMRKAQDRMTASKPYAEKILQVVGHLAKSHPEYQHEFLTKRDVKRAGFIVVSTDRGLCGALNSTMFRKLAEEMRTMAKENIEIDLCVIGTKGLNFFKRFGGNLIAEASHLGDAPSVESLIGIVKVMLEAYKEKKIDLLYLVSNEFINTMTQKPKLLQLLPLVPTTDEKLNYRWDYIYEPDAKEIITALMQRYIESEVYQAVVENFAAEQSSRMVAMKNASENAAKVIDELQLKYNKARQAAITQEIAEIVGGAAAIE